MIDEVKEVAGDILKKKDPKELIHIIYLLGVVLITIGITWSSLQIRNSTERSKKEDNKINTLSTDISNLSKVVTEGFSSQDKKIDTWKMENELQHQGINKKMEILKVGIDKNRRIQMDLIDELIGIKATSSIFQEQISPLKDLQSTYNNNYKMSSQIYNAIKVQKDTIKKNINQTHIQPI